MFGIATHRQIGAPGHGKGEVDAENGVTKNWIRKFLRTIKIAGLTNKELEDKFFSACLVDQDCKLISMADAIVKILKQPDRKDGVTGDKKHRKREANKKYLDRDYVAVHYGKLDQAATVNLLTH